MTRSFVRFAVAASTVGFLLTSCAGKKEEPAPEVKTEQPAPETTPAPADTMAVDSTVADSTMPAVEEVADSTTEKVQKNDSRGSMSGDVKAGEDSTATTEKVQKRRSRGSMTAPKDS